jgi:hypothetical protein
MVFVKEVFAEPFALLICGSDGLEIFFIPKVRGAERGVKGEKGGELKAERVEEEAESPTNDTILVRPAG